MQLYIQVQPSCMHELANNVCGSMCPKKPLSKLFFFFINNTDGFLSLLVAVRDEWVIFCITCMIIIVPVAVSYGL